ncbi:Endoglucanase cel12C [Verticillium nonalfalfae]|uniref:Endoglucanase-1 n=2 Tax=Verticillium TaxID=1036719 RepID=C9SD36_VERA1|nr:endoglucanase-1 [Verticillium alfalfae VaMs.102]XP_028492658.1 Endoglucanase cel12C [Verticillium nonalfalfae]EEY17001.1 endoglucanase-1 [Verticillium alfalfae VaMs.102]RNJ54500.1 Endoglucanase cel12C [Verticillium nonalfalfae]
MKVAALLALPLAVLASPLSARQSSTFCDDWGSAVAGPYTVYNNLWGKGSATSGQQCTTLSGLSGNAVSWSTSWSWAGGQNNVKSYPNALLAITKRPLSQVSSIPSSWSWSYTGSSLVANVAYDLFTGNTADSAPAYEIMIWLGSLGGAGPISATGSTIANPTIAGTTWKLYQGSHSQMNVFSFVAPSNIRSFNADLYAFVNYLAANHGLPKSQILQSVGAGTEPFTGSNAVFTTSSYQVSVS